LYGSSHRSSVAFIGLLAFMGVNSDCPRMSEENIILLTEGETWRDW
jgi:hypothetical protein